MDTRSTSGTTLLDTVKQHTGLVIGGAVIVAFLVVGIWWLLKPTYEALVQNLSDEGRAEVLASLMQQQVPYEIDESTGSIMVPAEQVASLRAQLSAQGLPSKQSVGLELFSQGDYGMSEFAQRINYQRALEGELARTIQSIEEVRHARVHVTLGKSSIFENRKEPAKASVVLQLKPERQLAGQQVFGVQQMVAAAVPALSAEQVVVLDDMGRTLSSADGAAGGDRWSTVRQMEQDYEARLRTLLTGALPETEFQLSVKLQVNFDKVKSVKEEVIPAKGQQTGYLLKKREQVSSGQSGSGQSVAGTQNNNNAETEYLFGRERAEIERAVGAVERINVAVVASTSLTAPMTDTLRTVIQSGLGLTPERGDSVAIVGSLAAAAVEPVVLAEPLITAESAPAAIAAEPSATLSAPVVYGIGFGVALLLLTLIGVSLKRARPTPAQPRQLSYEERERLLQQVRLWLVHEQAK